MRLVTVGWTDPDTEEEYRVLLEIVAADTEHASVEVLTVREDPGGRERPDLVARVSEELDLGELAEPDPWTIGLEDVS